MKGLKPYISPFLLLVALLAIFFVCYVKLGLAEHGDKSIAILLSAIGLIFAIFQVFLNLSVQGARNKAQLRHTEYKELIKLLNSISENLTEYLTKKITVKDLQILATSLLNKQNEFMSFVINNDNYLFKGIQKNHKINECNELLRNMNIITDKFKVDLGKLEKNKKKSLTNDFDWSEVTIDSITRMEWDYNINDNLKKFNDKKHEVLSELQRYIQ